MIVVERTVIAFLRPIALKIKYIGILIRIRVIQNWIDIFRPIAAPITVSNLTAPGPKAPFVKIIKDMKNKITAPAIQYKNVFLSR